ncbi:hypothetical protein [Burkholderia sp. Ac-20353]|uniref:hypothetical protein n=1 Tax=Burkholderia sp. Ac-20353 TaxID=2703894 RepID=UPI00197B8B0B|nr:hypothetical protein [Burkholderia sp. Ac-20353]MBN3789711.1 hypothetical protein [Burkholderia sp. Ac-20353]
MNIKIFNVCLLLGWLMVLAGGVIVNPGWGVAIAGALMVFMTLAAAYISGWARPANRKANQSEAA